MVATPARGTRPRNRRALIVAAASDLFFRRGYAHVSMGDVATAVAVGPSALYRHFPGKRELLVETVLDGLRPFEEILSRAGIETFDWMVERLAAAALERRPLGVLWQRECRHLPENQRAEVRRKVRAGVRSYARVLSDRRPECTPVQAEFLAWCTFAVLTSPSYHRLDPAGLPDLLVGLAHAVATTALPEITEKPGKTDRTAPVRTRREELLRTAAVMFAENGYATASLQEIGARVDIAGPSIYHHFDSKLDLLMAVMNRGADWLRADLARTLEDARDSGDALSRLVRSYVGFALDHSELIDVLITEVAHLPDAERRWARQSQRDYVAEWVRLAMAGPDADTARVRVQAALTVVNDVARTPHLRHTTGIAGALHEVGMRLVRPASGGISHS